MGWGRFIGGGWLLSLELVFKIGKYGVFFVLLHYKHRFELSSIFLCYGKTKSKYREISGKCDIEEYETSILISAEQQRKLA